jgi:4-carboxymuconolactone decarboxylase
MQRDHRDRAIGLSATALVVVIVLLAPGSAQAQALDLSRGGSRVVRQAPSENFTGIARVDMLFGALHSSDATGGSVAFEPGARTAWHAHPGGQTLIVTAGTGRVQRWGDDVQEIRSGDVVRIPPGQKHWHGAAPRTAMTHIAITEPRGGTAVEWMEPVTDEQFNAPPVGEPGSTPARPDQQAAPPTAPTQPPVASRPSGALQQRLAPGLASLTDDVLYGDVWRRPELSARDRSLVTIAILIATGKTAQLAGHLSRGFENGLQPRETSGLLAHLAIYGGWPNAVSALQVYEQVYATRKVDTAALGDVAPRRPALPASAGRPPALDPSVAAVAPKFAQLTADVVFGDLWRRSDLAPRDRSLVTIAALAAMGDSDQLDVYLHGGIASGLTRAEIAEAVTHLGFYAGWGKATTAMTALARVPQEPIR